MQKWFNKTIVNRTAMGRPRFLLCAGLFFSFVDEQTQTSSRLNSSEAVNTLMRVDKDRACFHVVLLKRVKRSEGK